MVFNSLKRGVFTNDHFCLACHQVHPHPGLPGKHWLRCDSYELVGICSDCPDAIPAWDRGDINPVAVRAAFDWQASISGDKAIKAAANDADAEKAAERIRQRIQSFAVN